MSDLQKLEEKIAQFILRTGVSSVERKDLGGDVAAEREFPKFDIDLKVQTALNALRVDVDLSIEDEHATYRAVISGQWFSEHEDAFKEALEKDNPALEELMMTVLAPQAIAATQSKLMDLARSVDCPPVPLPYDIYRQIRDSRPRSEGVEASERG